jgi:hypothetical protein
MKWIKKFNERLDDPETYIRAGNFKLGLGKGKSGRELIDYGWSKKSDFYDCHLYLYSSNYFTGTFTDLKCSNFYWGDPRWSGPQFNTTTTLLNKNLDCEDLVQEWKNGSQLLAFTLEFNALPTQESQFKSTTSNFELPYRPILFCITVQLSYWEDGLDSYNYLEDDDRYLQPGDDYYSDLQSMYEHTKQVAILLNNGTTKSESGIFANRQSARKFLQNIPQLLLPHKGNIMDLLSIVGGGPDDIERIMNSFNRMSINNFYQDELPKTLTISDIRKWYQEVRISG